MKTSVLVSRLAQLSGAVLMIGAIVSCAGSGPTQGASLSLFGGFFLILAARTVDWLTRE